MADIRKARMRTLTGPALVALFGAALPQAALAAGSIAFIEQVGDYNRTTINQSAATNSTAAVTIRGTNNGQAAVAARTAAVVSYPSLAAESTLGTPALDGGTISQTGQGHLALVNVFGDENTFSIFQKGTANGAVQAIKGNGNQAGAWQVGMGNAVVQGQSGNANAAVAIQNGGTNNQAVQLQGGTNFLLAATAVNLSTGLLPVATLAGALGAANSAESALSSIGSGSRNVSLLEQNGDNNAAVLVQAGNDNTIALRQPGSAYAAILQYGNGHTIGIDQQAGVGGVSPIVVTQF